MDIFELIDKLDDVMHKARPVPLTDQVRIDKEEVYDILDQMRATVPEEIKQARFIVEQRQRGESGAAGGGVDQQALTEAVTAAIRANIPEIARAAASAPSQPPGMAAPPGGPF
jgi:hypothetical protein